MEILVFDTLEKVMARELELSAMLSAALNVNQPFDETLRQINFRNGNSIIVAGEVDGQLATMNAFMRQSFIIDGKPLTAYQSGSSATANSFRGQGLWPRLIAAAEDLLAARGTEWVFGFPNPVSHPLFSKKLGYSTVEMFAKLVPALMLGWLPKVTRDAAYAYPDIGDVIDKHAAQPNSRCVSFMERGNAGVAMPSRRRGIGVMDVGAWHAEDMTVGEVLRRLQRLSHSPVVRMEVSATSQYARSLNVTKYSRPFIYKVIGQQKFPDKIDIFGGLSDTF